MKGSATPVSTRQEEAVYCHLTRTSQARPRRVRLPSHEARLYSLSYPPGLVHQTIATAPSCSSFSSPWDRWCLKRFSAAKSPPRAQTLIIMKMVEYASLIIMKMVEYAWGEYRGDCPMKMIRVLQRTRPRSNFFRAPKDM